MAVRIENPKAAEPLFQGWQESMVWSCLQQVMGAVYGDDGTSPRCAVAVLGDFCFLAGEPWRELVMFRQEGRQQDFAIMVPQHDGWSRLIETVYGKEAKRIERYAVKKEKDVFREGALQEAAASLPAGYELRLIDEELFLMCREQQWSRDFVSNYPDFGTYQKLGLGVAALENGIIVAGASSYSSYRGGIEVEIDTREDHRRLGLAYACGARLVLECLRRGLYPSWDAHNRASAALAQKLGYHVDYAYPAYEIYGFS